MRLVKSPGLRIVACGVDVRDQAGADAAFVDGLAEFRHLDIVLVNAGMRSVAPTRELGDKNWDDMFAVNSTGG